MPKSPTTNEAAESAVAAVKAIHRITYGANQLALPDTIFRPTTEQELADLRSLHAVADLSPAEAALFGQADDGSAGAAINAETGATVDTGGNGAAAGGASGEVEIG